MSRSILVLTVVLFTACADRGDHSPSPDLGPTPDAAAPLDMARPPASIDLQAFRDHAIDVLAGLGFSNSGDGDLVFVDGAGSIGDPPLYDYARLYYVAKTSDSWSPDPSFRVGYYVSLQGFDAVAWVKLGPGGATVSGLGGTATFVDGTPAADRAALASQLKAAHPMATITLLDMIGVLTFEGKSPSDATAIHRALRMSTLVGSAELDYEVYRVEFRFAAPHPLGKGATPELVDLTTLTTVTRDLRAMGVAFTTAPHLPAPFAP